MIQCMVIPFIGARNFTRVNQRGIDLIVIHDMEAPEAQDTAENVARWFAGASAPRASAHYCIDSNSIVQCVRDVDVAWHAPGANHDGIGLELAGYARQSRDEWRDAYSEAMLELAAQLTAALCRKHKIPMVYRSWSQLRAGLRGITTHDAVSKAFGGTHWDPGPNFPMGDFVKDVRRFSAGSQLSPHWPADRPSPIPKWFWAWATWRFAGRVGPRPTSVPKAIPRWAWRYLEELHRNRRKKGR